MVCARPWLGSTCWMFLSCLGQTNQNIINELLVETLCFFIDVIDTNCRTYFDPKIQVYMQTVKNRYLVLSYTCAAIDNPSDTLIHHADCPLLPVSPRPRCLSVSGKKKKGGSLPSLSLWVAGFCYSAFAADVICDRKALGAVFIGVQPKSESQSTNVRPVLHSSFRPVLHPIPSIKADTFSIATSRLPPSRPSITTTCMLT